MDQSGSTSDPATPPPPTGGWAAPPAPVMAGPAGFVYADVPNRAIAYIIDVIILVILNVIVYAVLAAVGLSIISGLTYNYFAGLVLAVASLAISGAYFIYTWTAMRGTIGMKALGMQIGNANDGKTLTMDQAIRRWIVLGAPFGIAQAFNPLPGIGILLGLASLAWFIFLLWTTYSSPTKQGFHDKFVNSMVVKATRVAA
jgi:uncharacterized RDD family membrane protein YckC